jgi:methyl-accepting chemotaxis protein
MFNTMKIKTKLLTAFLAVGIIPFSFIGLISFINSENALSEQAFSKLEAIRDAKKDHIQNFFAEHREDTNVLIETVSTLRQAAFDKLKTVQEIKKAQIEEYFHKCRSDVTVMSKNSTVVEALESFSPLFDKNGNFDEAAYGFYEELKYGDSFRHFKEEYGYYDVLLVNKTGRVVYSFVRESDFGQNLLTGNLKNSGLGRCFKKSLKEPSIEDFSQYSPSEGQYIAFISAPIQLLGQIEGVIVVKLNKDALNTIVHRRQGMGETGETYLIAEQQDGKIAFRSDRVIRQGIMGQEKSGDQIMPGKSGSLVSIGSTGSVDIFRYDPLDIPGLNWTVITIMSLEEAIAPKLEGTQEDYFTRYIKHYGYKDLLLIHPGGTVFYSVEHYSDYGTNMKDGVYADSVLGKLFRTVLETREFGFADFERYEPDGGNPSAFIAQPLVYNGKVEWVVALQISIDGINAVMQKRSGMGESGETYLVGSDNLMRSNSLTNPVHYSVNASFANPQSGMLDTQASRYALSGKTGRDVITGYHGRQVLSAYTPLNIWDIRWALIAEIDKSEAFSALDNLKNLMNWVALIVIVFIALISLVFSGYIIQPVNRVAERMRDIAGGEGDLTLRLKITATDEIGELAKWFNTFIGTVQEMIKEISRNAQTLAMSSSKFLSISGKMSSDATRVSEISDSVSITTEEMSVNIHTMASAAEEMSANIHSISSTSEQMSQSMSVVASAIKEMSAAIHEIAVNAGESDKVSKQAMEMAASATDNMTRLGEAAKGIGEVTDIIKRIAEQTNLLALNATIEAASAGDAGKGFAVVAKEIKELANQSGLAAEDIAGRIRGVQKKTEEAVRAINDVSKIISSINDATAVTTNAVDQYTRMTKDILANSQQTDTGAHNIASAIAEIARGADDMSRNAGEAAKGANEVSAGILSVSHSAEDSKGGAEQVNQLVEELVRITGELQRMVNQFKVDAEG